MKYYQEHEQAYQRLIREGFLGWDKKKSIEDLLNFSQKEELDRILELLLGTRQNILDLGCGTGPASFHFATQDHEVTGIDVSETAIKTAEAIKAKLGVKVKFICGDFLETPFSSECFSMVIDSSFLHCIVFGQERDKCLRRIYDLLKPGGIFVVHTMVSDRRFDFGPDFEIDDEGILWYLSNNSNALEAKPHPRGFATPQRKILPSHRLQDELKAVGLIEIESKILSSSNPNGTDLLFGSYQKPV